MVINKYIFTVAYGSLFDTATNDGLNINLATHKGQTVVMKNITNSGDITRADKVELKIVS